MRKILLFCFLQIAIVGFAKKPLRVACVGNSVTFGYGLSNPSEESYPSVLQRLLGNGYEVRNYGHSGTTLLTRGHRPYIKTKEFREALLFKPDRVVIHLGLNDTDPRNWPNYSEDFVQDYRALIDSFREINPDVRIWICQMSPIGHRHPRFQSGTRDWFNQIQQQIVLISQTADVECIDFHTPLYTRPDLFPDALHPNAEGARMIAETVYAHLSGDFNGLQLPVYYGNGMVLQRGETLTFHGKANAGESVKVVFNGKISNVVAAKNGMWRTSYRCPSAGGPYKLVCSTKGVKKIIDSLYVGDVWLCSGQSNMEFPVKSSSSAAEDIQAAANNKHLFLFNMLTRYPTNDVEWEPAVLDSVNNLRLYAQARWQHANAATVGSFSAIAYHFGKELSDSLHIPIGIICNAVGGTTTESWIDRRTLEWEFPQILYDWYYGDFGMAWARERALKNIKKAQHKLQRHPYEPCYMFETGMLPLADMRVKGVVWYQGESNAHNIELHERLFPLLQASWRSFFQDPQMPFYVVQLSSCDRPSWPRFRNSQRLLAARCPNTYMTVTADLGDSLDVHFPCKQPAGSRLARQALCHSYMIDVQGDSPCLLDVVQEGNSLRLIFSHAEGLKAAGGRLQGFEVAGSDGLFYDADAEIQGQSVIIRCAKVPHPHSVRYAWKPFTRANLVNGAGFPASTFIKTVK